MKKLTQMELFEEERKKNTQSADGHPVHPVKMRAIETRVPSKWRIVDLQTGQVYRWDEESDRFVVAEDNIQELANLRKAILDEDRGRFKAGEWD